MQAKLNGNRPLPSWLFFDKTSGTFWGVPTSDDVGVLDITLRGYLNSDTITSQFRLNIIEDPTLKEPKRKCQSNEDFTLLNLMVDVDIQAIKPKQKIIAINNIAKFLGLPAVSIKNIY